MNLQIFLKYIYNDLFVPIYIYEDRKLISAFPEEALRFPPPTEYLLNFEANSNNTSYSLTKELYYYGYVKKKEAHQTIIIGPVKEFSFNKSIINKMSTLYNIELTHEVIDFFGNIPQVRLDVLLNKLLLINYCLNNENLSRTDLVLDFQEDYSSQIAQNQMETKYDEIDIIVGDYDIEDKIARYVERGDTERLMQLTKQSRGAHVGIMASDSLRQWKNTFIILVSVVSRSAIRGGVSPSIAFPLASGYIQQAEKITDSVTIKQLAEQCQLDFANRVKKAKVPDSTDPIIRKVIDYIYNHINNPISVEEIAENVGFTRSYLSRKFKKDIGISLSDFIRKEKMEHAKDLLRFSTKSISEISNYLGFSSQSYFQKTFKSYESITPKKYRETFKKE